MESMGKSRVSHWTKGGKGEVEGGIRGLLPLLVVCGLVQITDAQGFSPGQILNGQTIRPFATAAGDLDGDGDLDLLSASGADGKIAWYSNLDGQGHYGPQRVITEQAVGARSVVVADIDSDGDADVLSAAFAFGEIAWYPNTDGLGTFGPPILITSQAYSAIQVLAADLDGDGDPDALSLSESPDLIAWYENTDGYGSFGPMRQITTQIDHGNEIFTADLDGDGDKDVLSASYHDDLIAWYENTDGAGSFGAQRIITDQAHGACSVAAADLDGDGDHDVLSAAWEDGEIVWYENSTGTGVFGAKQIIVDQALAADAVATADIDGDGDQDVLSTTFFNPLDDGELAWSENLGGLGTFGPPQAISTALYGEAAILSVDDDGDGDLDVVSTSSLGSRLARYENTDGLGSFGPQESITTVAEGAIDVIAADLDGDGDLDALSASFDDDKIVRNENIDGYGFFGTERLISTEVERATSVRAADVDGDGNLDVIASSRGLDEIVWYPNTDGQGAFGSARIITDLADAVLMAVDADVDGDGDLDVLSACWQGNELAWYENTDGAGSFGPKQIITAQAYGVRAVFAADLEGDGDNCHRPDIVLTSSSSWYPSSRITVGYEYLVQTWVCDENGTNCSYLSDTGCVDIEFY